jgi:hypothetical protein
MRVSDSRRPVSPQHSVTDSWHLGRKMVADNTLRNLACRCPAERLPSSKPSTCLQFARKYIEEEIQLRGFVKIIGDVRDSIDRSILAAADRITESKAVAAIIRALSKSGK